jgi:hypothetical protein
MGEALVAEVSQRALRERPAAVIKEKVAAVREALSVRALVAVEMGSTHNRCSAARLRFSLPISRRAKR